MSDLKIAKPCAADWNAMTPAEAGRHCAECDKVVIDLTCLAPAQRVAEFYRISSQVAQGHRVCVRTHATHDGWLTTRRVLSNGMAALLAMSIAGCQGDGPTTSQTQSNKQGTETQPVAGGIVAMGEFPSVSPSSTAAPVAPVMLGSPAPNPTRIEMGDVASPAQHPRLQQPEAVKGRVISGEAVAVPAPSPAKAPEQPAH